VEDLNYHLYFSIYWWFYV